MASDASGKTPVDSGDQICLQMNFNPKSVVVSNSSPNGNTAYRYAWIYNDATLISQPAHAATDPCTLGPVDTDTLNPPQGQGASGTVSPSTLVIYNLGPYKLDVRKL